MNPPRPSPGAWRGLALVVAVMAGSYGLLLLALRLAR